MTEDNSSEERLGRVPGQWDDPSLPAPETKTEYSKPEAKPMCDYGPYGTGEFCEHCGWHKKLHPMYVALEAKQVVWVALWASQMDASFVGVFSSREFAEEAAALFQEEEGYGDGYVEQWEIDGKRILV